MRYELGRLVLVVTVLAAVSSGAVAAPEYSLADSGRNYVANERLVKFKSSAPSDRALEVRQAVGAADVRELGSIRVQHWHLGRGAPRSRSRTGVPRSKPAGEPAPAASGTAQFHLVTSRYVDLAFDVGRVLGGPRRQRQP